MTVWWAKAHPIGYASLTGTSYCDVVNFVIFFLFQNTAWAEAHPTGEEMFSAEIQKLVLDIGPQFAYSAN